MIVTGPDHGILHHGRPRDGNTDVAILAVDGTIGTQFGCDRIDRQVFHGHCTDSIRCRFRTRRYRSENGNSTTQSNEIQVITNAFPTTCARHQEIIALESSGVSIRCPLLGVDFYDLATDDNSIRRIQFHQYQDGGLLRRSHCHDHGRCTIVALQSESGVTYSDTTQISGELNVYTAVRRLWHSSAAVDLDGQNRSHILRSDIPAPVFGNGSQFVGA